MLVAWVENPHLRELLSQWSREIDLDLLHLGTVAGVEEIKDTSNAQPLIVAAGLLAWRALNADAKFHITTGHSVGEITSLVFAGILSEIDALALVRARGLEMAKAAALVTTGMSAVLGGDRVVVLKAIAAAGLVAANENGSGQIVAAGDLQALANLAPEGARVRALSVAGAFHSHYMQPALAPLQARAQTLHVGQPRIGFISNRDGEIVSEGMDALNRIVNQITNPVRWDLCMAQLKAMGVTGVIEVPPAGTLTGLIKRAQPSIETFALKSPADIELAQEFIQRHQES